MMQVIRVMAFGVALAALLAAGSSRAKGESPDEQFYRAYYLEQAQGDLAGASELYREVAGDRRAAAELKTRASVRLASCQEDLASSDFARLMPPDALLYVELNRPGEQLSTLLEQLGLMGAVSDADGKGLRVAISPALIHGLLGVRGVAAAITGIDPIQQKPSGVAIFHPGDMDVIRGLIETGLPVAATPMKAIGGHPTYDIEGQAVVTLTSRLVIAATHRQHIQDVVRRLSGEEQTSLATNADLADALAGRKDSLLFFCVHTKPIMPMLNAMLSGQGNQKAAMIKALLDPQSLKSVVGQLGVRDDSLFLDVSLNLHDGHHNLVYNFLRTPAITQDLLKGIPAGAAGFLVGAMNEAPSRYPASSSNGSDDAPVITALDFGREVFANIIGWAVFALPPEGGAVSLQGEHPFPDLAAAITVHDPAKSEGLWRQILGIASLAAGAPTMEGEPTEIEGVTVQQYRFPEGVSVHFATLGNQILVASSPSAMARSIAAKRSGNSILKDDAFTNGLDGVDAHTTKALFLHAGRCFEIGKPFMSSHDLAEAAPFIAALSDTVLSVALTHSSQTLRISGRVSGIPQVGELVAEKIAMERSRGRLQHKLGQAKRQGDWNAALATADELSAANPDDRRLQIETFDLLAVGKNDEHAARAKADQIAESLADDANGLNNFAWALLTDEKYDGLYDDVALQFAQRSNTVSGFESWAYLDTLALARFRAGDVAAAVELQRKAIDKCPENRRDDLTPTLEKYESADASVNGQRSTEKMAATP